MATALPKRPGSAGRGRANRAAKQRVSTHPDLQVTGRSSLVSPDPVEDGKLPSFRQMMDDEKVSRAETARDVSTVPGSSPRCQTSLGGPLARPNTSLGMAGSSPPPRPSTSLGLTESVASDSSPSPVKAARSSVSKKQPSVDRSFCSTELPSSSRSYFSASSGAPSKGLFSTEVHESFNMSFEDFDESLLGFPSEFSLKSRDLRLLPVSKAAQAFADQCGPGLLCRLEKDIANQSARLRNVQEQGISCQRATASVPASLQKIRFQEHRFLLDQLVIEHGKHQETVSKFRDIEQKLQAEQRLREEVEVREASELQWRLEARANLEAKDKYLNRLISEHEERTHALQQEIDKRGAQIQDLTSRCEALESEVAAAEQRKTKALAAMNADTQRQRREMGTLKENTSRLDQRLFKESQQKAYWEQRASDLEKEVDDLRRLHQQQVEKASTADETLKQVVEEKSREYTTLLKQLQEERRERRREQDEYRKEKQQQKAEAKEHLKNEERNRELRHVHTWLRFAHQRGRLGMCRRIILAQKRTEQEEMRSLERSKSKISMRAALSNIKLDTLRKDYESLELENAELKFRLGLNRSTSDGPPPEQWGIRVSQLKEFRDEIMEDLVRYCKCHQVQKLADGEHRHVCRQDPCPFQDDHRGVDYRPTYAAVVDGFEHLEQMTPNMRVVVDRYVKHITRGTNKSFALTLAPEGQQCTVFITHSWGGDFGGFVNALEQTLEDHEVVWVCSFALPQSNRTKIEQQLNEELTQTPFAVALSEALKHVVVVDGDLTILKRVWCLYELSRGLKLGVPVFLRSAEPKTLLELRIRVHELDVRKAEASEEADKKRIDEAIERQGGYEELNKHVINCIRERGDILFDGECLEALRKMDELHEQLEETLDGRQKKRIRERAQELANHALRQQARLLQFNPAQHDKMLKDHEAKLQKLLQYHEEKLNDLSKDGDEEQVIQLKNDKRAAEMEMLANKREQSLITKIEEMTDKTKNIFHMEYQNLQQNVDVAVERHMENLKFGLEQKMEELLKERDHTARHTFQNATRQLLQMIPAANAFSSVKSAPVSPQGGPSWTSASRPAPLNHLQSHLLGPAPPFSCPASSTAASRGSVLQRLAPPTPQIGRHKSMPDMTRPESR